MNRINGCMIFFGVVLLLLCQIGCGGQGLDRYELDGQVTFDGKPLQNGRIAFEPDSRKQNRGPAAYANVIDGQYQTSRQKGHVGGNHKVRISGYQGEYDRTKPLGRALFPTYHTTVDLPNESSTRDFEVPTD